MKSATQLWDATVVEREIEKRTETGTGCLLQIHPMDIGAELIHLNGPQVVLGREPNSGICIDNESVSRQHALIEIVNGQHHLNDMNSTNGTFLNEARIEKAPLCPGDRVQLGNVIFKFLETDHIELEYHETVYSIMTRDGLTEAINKRLFSDLLTREFGRACHRNQELTLILFDIDYFKSVNDKYGHLAGDEVLKETSERIRSVISAHEIFARYGGEEFAILLPDTEVEEGVEIAECCRIAIESADFKTSSGPIPIRISAGVCGIASLQLNPLENNSPDLLVELADKMLYKAKANGRNRVCF